MLIIILISIVLLFLILVVTSNLDHREVFQISNNVFDYGEACDVCPKIGAKMATKEQLASAAADGANWENLGWISCGEAYRPNGSTIVGGRIPTQIKLGVHCYGDRPRSAPKKLSIAPWNMFRWSKFDA